MTDTLKALLIRHLTKKLGGWLGKSLFSFGTQDGLHECTTFSIFQKTNSAPFKQTLMSADSISAFKLIC